MTGDSRSDLTNPREGMDVNGVNTLILGEIAQMALREKPAFLLFSGDLGVGGKTDAQIESQWNTWFESMAPVFNAGIRVYTVRGNHDIFGQHPAQNWRKAFQGKYAMPANGPTPEKDMTYSFSYKNALIVGLDQFQGEKAHVNQAWLDRTLRTDKKQHLFVFAHKMAFRVGVHVDNLDNDVVARDRFWNSIAAAGGRTFFCGHDHLYDHTAFTASGWPMKKAIHQFLIGTAGAPFYHGNDRNGANGPWLQTPISHIEDKFGYTVVDVDGPKVTITFKARQAPGVYVAADTWSYLAPVREFPKKRSRF